MRVRIKAKTISETAPGTAQRALLSSRSQAQKAKLPPISAAAAAAQERTLAARPDVTPIGQGSGKDRVSCALEKPVLDSIMSHDGTRLPAFGRPRIEHPQLVAQRIERFAGLVGCERVIAGVDCGFATFAEHPSVDPEIAWAKLAALVEGASLASARL